MNNTALGAENKRNRQSILSAKHMKNSTMKNEKRYAIRMCTTRHFAIALASVVDTRRNINSIYVLDADGNRIPNASGKGYKSRKVNVIDWNEKGKAKEWRNAIAEVINATNEKAGIAEHVDPRSYKDREIPLIPTIHLGERASVLERKGIRTERGDINRAIEKYNAIYNEDLWIYF